jgi:hypothetical protein
MQKFKNKNPKGAGRPTVPAHLKRNPMTGVRIQQWLLERLMQQPGSKGQLIERLLKKEFGIIDD